MTQDTTQDVQPAPVPTPAPPATGWRQRLYGLRSVIAVAVAALVLGGLGGAALGYAANGGDQGGRGGFGGQRGGFPGGQGFPGQQGGPQGQQGQQNGGPRGSAPTLPGQTTPSTAPTQDVQPDS